LEPLRLNFFRKELKELLLEDMVSVPLAQVKPSKERIKIDVENKNTK
jgi:hypothetical protein